MSAAGEAEPLVVDIDVPERGVRLAVTARAGVTTAVIGPNGSGKSTMLGALSGAVAARGIVRLGATDLSRLPAHRRGLGYLQQDAALFSHLSVLENVAFGPRVHGVRRSAARAKARGMLEEVEAIALADRRPSQLSGGQAQRIAIARALAADPEVVLLDEPFAALDADVTGRLRAVLARSLASRTAILVTHDLLDVLALADDVVVLEEGRVRAHGPREEILTRPPTPFVARLTGRLLLPGRIEHGRLIDADGRAIPGRLDDGLADGDLARALVDPAHVRLEPAAASDPQAVPIREIDRLGSRVLVRAGLLAAEIEATRAIGLDLRPGSPVRLDVDPASTLIMRAPETAGKDEAPGDDRGREPVRTVEA